jgi:SAM-dependent methyltransferase
MAFKRGLENPICETPSYAEWYSTDNGFSTVAAMDSSHAAIAATANRLLAQTPGRVLDLGCGNGALLKRLADANPHIVPFGVDIGASRIAHARELLPDFAENFIAGNLFDAKSLWSEGQRYVLAMLMPGRLLEATPDEVALLKSRLKAQCDHVLIYAYGDWLTRFGELKDLAEAAGLEIVDIDNRRAIGVARVIDFK